MVKRLVREFNFYWKFVCTDKNNDKNKTNLPPPASTPAIVFLITQKLLSKLKKNFQNFSLSLLIFLSMLLLFLLNLLSFLMHWITSHFLNVAFYKLFYMYFYCLDLCETKSFDLKTELYFTLLWFVLDWDSLLQY